MAKLEVQIGADSSELSAEISAAEAKIERLRKQKAIQVKLGMDTSALTKSINESKTQLASLKKSVDSAGQSFSGMKPQVANGGNALMQFSRIAQDAPYGIIGIGNNLTATAEAFSHLKNQTGSTGGALKALAGSLMGSGGILLGISLLTTGLTLLSQSGLSISDVFNKIKGDFDEFGQTMKKVSDEAKKSASEQISSLKGLIAIAQDENQSKKTRLEIVDQIQKQYPNYFGNLSKEKIMYGDLTGTVNELTNALINKAIAEKMAGVTADSTVNLWKANAKLVETKKQLLLAENAYNAAASDPDKAQSMQFYASAVDRAGARVKEARSEVLKFNAEVERGQNIINMASKNASKVIAQPLPIPKVTAPKPANVTPQVSGIGMSIQSQGLVETSGKILQIAKDVQGAEGVIKTSMTGINVAFDTSSLWMLESLQSFNDQANELISGSIADTFGQLGTAIGEALANGGNVLGAIGSTILQSLGKFLSDMGGMLIQYGTMAILKGKLDLAILTGGPAAIVAGIAAVGVGIALKAIGGAIGAKATGGASSGSSSPQTGASYSSPASSSSGSSSTFSGGNVVFEISGTSLIGVLSNSLDKNKRLGGSLGIV